jgi:predicted SprT family Zn-dependent metalloprotease
VAEKLEQLYAEYNQKYFGGLLPMMPVRWSKKCSRAHGAEFLDYQNGTYEILFNPCLQSLDKYTKLTLLHEMCHVQNRLKKQRDLHGPLWQRDMRRLARIGAFDELW